MSGARSENGSFWRSNLFVRLCSVAVLAPIVMLAGWFGSWWFFALVLIMSGAIQYEWARITRPDMNPWKLLGLLVLIMVELWLFQDGQWLAAGLLTAISFVLLTLWGFGRGRKMWLGIGHAYAALFGLALLLLRQDEAFGINALLFIISIVWATDIFAYFVGRSLGGPKLWPAISPGKTWSGAIGGLAAGVLAGLLIGWLLPNTSALYLLLLGALLSIASQSGDLFESWVKRRFQVKDSGRIIPGHGGVMDRVDGLIFALIAGMLVIYLTSGFDEPGRTLLYGAGWL